MCKNEQNVVLNESSEVFGNHLKIVWILVLAITTAEDDVAAHIQLFYNQNGDFWCHWFVSLNTK